MFYPSKLDEWFVEVFTSNLCSMFSLFTGMLPISVVLLTSFDISSESIMFWVVSVSLIEEQIHITIDLLLSS